MDKRKKVIKGLECCRGYCDEDTGCPFDEFEPFDCQEQLHADAIALLKAQEPRLLTKQDFENNPDLDSGGRMPVWIEYRRDDEEWAEYWDDTDDEWALVYQYNFESESYRCWNKKPTREQMEATPWKY